MAADGVTVGLLPGAGDRRLPAGGPDPVAGVRRPPVGRAGAVRGGDGGAAGGLRGRRRDRPPGAALQLRGGRRRRPDRRAGAEGEAADLQHLLRGADRVPRRRRSRTDEHRGVPFGDFLFRFDFGTLAVEVCEDIWSPDGPMKRRTYAGAELVANISASVYRVGIVADPAGADRDPRRRPPVHDRLRQPGRRQRRADLRRRRLRQPERQDDARGAALPGGLRDRGRRSRPHAAAARREHDLADRPRGVRRATHELPATIDDPGARRSTRASGGQR